MVIDNRCQVKCCLGSNPDSRLKISVTLDKSRDLSVSVSVQLVYLRIEGFPGGISGKEPACQCRTRGFSPRV